MKKLFKNFINYFFGDEQDPQQVSNMTRSDNQKYRQILADLNKELLEYKRICHHLIDENHALKKKNELYQELLADERVGG